MIGTVLGTLLVAMLPAFVFPGAYGQANTSTIADNAVAGVRVLEQRATDGELTIAQLQADLAAAKARIDELLAQQPALIDPAKKYHVYVAELDKTFASSVLLKEILFRPDGGYDGDVPIVWLNGEPPEEPAPEEPQVPGGPGVPGAADALPAWVASAPAIAFDPAKDLQKQIEAVPTGSKLVLPAGTFLLKETATLKRSKVAIVGAGKGKTKIECLSGMIYTGIGSRVDDVVLAGLSARAVNRDYDDPRFDLQRALEPANGVTIYGYGERYTIVDVELSKFGNGVVLDPQAKRVGGNGKDKDWVVELRWLKDIHLVRVFSHHNYGRTSSYTGQGLYAAFYDDLVVEDSEFSYNGHPGVPGNSKLKSDPIYVHGFYLKGWVDVTWSDGRKEKVQSCKGVLAVNCSFRDNSADNVQMRGGGGEVTYRGERVAGGLVNCYLADAGHGIWFGDLPTRIVNCIFEGNNWNLEVGSKDQGANPDVLIENVVIFDAKVDPNRKRGIQGLFFRGSSEHKARVRNVVVAAGSGGLDLSGVKLVEDRGNNWNASPAEVEAALAAIEEAVK